MDQPHAGPRPPRWAIAALLAILVLDIWLRGHVLGPTFARSLGVRAWPVIEGEAEPLDSDEAAYAIIGRRIVRGDVMYRDLTEHKPPGGYWLFAVAAALGGDELTVRLLPAPLVLTTLVLVWWIGLRIAGPAAACVAAMIYALLSTDPHLSGDAATLEHPLNLLAVASLALMVGASAGWGRPALAAAGAAVAGACLVRQVAVTHLIIYGSWVVIRRVEAPATGRQRLRDMAALLGGFGAVAGAVVVVLAVQGALPDAYHDCVRYAAFQAAEAPRSVEAPPYLVRWIVGEIDERDGRLPWPFGDSDRVRWWGAGLWPIWLALPLALAVLALVRPSGPRRLVVAWTLSAAVQVALPGLFWQHYYLLLAPGAALAYGALTGEACRRASEALDGSDPPRFYAWATAATALAAILVASGFALARSYLLTSADRLQPVFKGGSAWPQLREIGREIGHRAAATWTDPKLFVWGWQSPIAFYSGLEGASREVFTDPLLEVKARTDPDHPLIRPRLDRIIADLKGRPPEVVFVGITPFAELQTFLDAHYAPWRRMPASQGGAGIWVLRGDRDRFASARVPGPLPHAR
jgi:4-amino-4-deoxy-L-arabinose transferase-like glycosyltransferase